MNNQARRRLCAAALLVGLRALPGCDGGGEPAAFERAAPARRGRPRGRPAISAGEVARIAAAQGVDVAKARDIAVRDALLASEAAARGLTESPDARLAWDGELARRVLRRVLAEARARPPTAAELDAAAARRWLEVDRPEGFRTVHAVVRYEVKDDDAKKARARAVAEAIRAAALSPRCGTAHRQSGRSDRRRPGGG